MTRRAVRRGGATPAPPRVDSPAPSFAAARPAASSGGIVCLIATSGAILALTSAWLAGWRLETISSLSMEPELRLGSLALIVPTKVAEIEVGDVISFRDPADEDLRILHRVVEEVPIGAAATFFRTQGDANQTPDPMLVPSRNVLGRLRGAVPAMGRIAWALRPPHGLVILVGVPATLLLVTEVRNRRRGRSERAMPLFASDELSLLEHLQALPTR